jgi:uncharacterized protein YqhQ
MYKFLPLLATTELKRVNPIFGEQFVFNFVDGMIRIALFLLFVWGVSLWKDIRRVYEYHGAEHKTVFAFENGDPLEHGRGPEIFDVSSALRDELPDDRDDHLDAGLHGDPGAYILGALWDRIALLPVIAGVSYEIIRFAAKHRGSLFALMTAPGLWLQRITTQPPDDRKWNARLSLSTRPWRWRKSTAANW